MSERYDVRKMAKEQGFDLHIEDGVVVLEREERAKGLPPFGEWRKICVEFKASYTIREGQTIWLPVEDLAPPFEWFPLCYMPQGLEIDGCPGKKKGGSEEIEAPCKICPWNIDVIMESLR